MALRMTAEEMRQKREKRKKQDKPKGNSRRPQRDEIHGLEIEVTTQEHLVNWNALRALANDPTIFQRADQLVTINPDSAAIRVIPPAYLREKLCSQATFVRKSHTSEGQEQVRAVHPPDWCVRAIDARGSWPGLRRLDGVAEFPVLLADGTILSDPGYDPDSRVYLLWDGEAKIAPRPSRTDAQTSAQELLEVIADFPFANDSGRAVWIAALLTPIARFAYSGCTPLFLADANTRGSGKGLLINALHAILTGRQAAALSYPDTNEERRKLVCAAALGGERFVFLDNLRGRFGDSVIDSVLTTPFWKDRLMHTQRVVEIPLQAVWFATGNNVSIVADTGRRVCPMRLESPVERPEHRTDFKHASLIEWVIENRERLLAAACTILRAYCTAGRPDVRIQPWGSFESWSNLVRRAVVWVGLPDPSEACKTIAVQADSEAQDVAALLELWEALDPQREGFTTKQLMEEPDLHDRELKHFQEILKDILPRYETRSLGSLLKKYRRRIIGGRFADFRIYEGRRLWSVFQEADFSQQKFPEPPEPPEPPD